VIIGIDTSTPAVSVALGDDSGLVASLRLLRGRRHVETVIPAIEQLLVHADCSYDAVTAIAVDIGPGLFTGLRVGVATAKALALALNVPVYAASSLEIIVHQWIASCGYTDALAKIRATGEVDVLAVIDARRRELYAQRFSVRDGRVTHVEDPTCVAPVEALALIDGSLGTRVIGDAAVGSPDFAGRTVSPGTPDASTLVTMVSDLKPTHPDELELLYLRAPDAEINWTSRP
jgi:tRNA threonylcarbamoyladenosine biosynthesis protein TsaB